MFLLIIICLLAFLVLIWHSRRIGVTVGLPIAYLFSLLLQHLPGAYAHVVGGNLLLDSNATLRGLELTTIGTVSFVIGVLSIQRFSLRRARPDFSWLEKKETSKFALICFSSGWVMVMLGIFFGNIPSLGAAMNNAASVWILGALIGVLMSVRARNLKYLLVWGAALAAYPLLILIKGGFLSFGSTSVFIVSAAVLVSVRSHIRAYAGVATFSILCFLVFLSYFQNRNEIRELTWGGGSFEARVSKSTSIVTDLGLFDSQDPAHLAALDSRLNQNFFAGRAYERIEKGEVDYLYGRSFWEGALALVPRALWPDKPIFAGSSDLIREYCDFQVNLWTSFGVGQVMEFYINFGIPSVVLGFLLFGLLYGWIDKNAAAALQRSAFLPAVVWFLPGVAMNMPLASISEISGNVAAAVVAGFGWCYAWPRIVAILGTRKHGCDAKGSRKGRRVRPKESKAERATNQVPPASTRLES